MSRVALPVLWVRKAVQSFGLHPQVPSAEGYDLPGGKALIVATNRGVLEVGKATGVFASELTAAYYAFLDAGLSVDVASPQGGVIPVDPLSLNPVVRTAADDRFLDDEDLLAKIEKSLNIADVDVEAYEIVYLAGGWGAAFDLGFSAELAEKITLANAKDVVIGGVCHGPLGLINATGIDGRPLVEGRHVTAVSDRQIKELKVAETPQHPETELRKKGADYSARSGFRDVLANHWVVDGNLVTGQNQNAGPMVAREMLRLARQRRHADPSRTPPSHTAS